MNVLINALGIRIGGGVRHLAPFVRSLARAEPGWQLHLLASYGQAAPVADVPLASVHEFTATGTARRLWWDASGVCRHARGVGADCIVNLANHGPLRPSVPNILFQRNSYFFDPQWTRQLRIGGRIEAAAKRRLAQWEIAAADIVVTPTDAMANFIRSWPASAIFNQVTIPHAVDAEEFPYIPRPLRSLADVQLAVIGGAAPHKGIDTAVRLIAELRRRGHHPQLFLTIPRHGGLYQDYVDNWASIAHELGVSERVHFVGSTERVQELYASADVAVFPSITESFGFPLLEAMASGTPILASDIPASREVAGEYAMWFGLHDHIAAADRLEEAIRVPIEAAVAALDSGRRRAEALTWDRNATEVAGVVRRCVGAAAIARP